MLRVCVCGRPRALSMLCPYVCCTADTFCIFSGLSSYCFEDQIEIGENIHFLLDVLTEPYIRTYHKSKYDMID